MAAFKIRRNLLARQSASIAESLDADYGVNTLSGSVSTFSGGLTAGSTFTVTGSAIIGGSTPAIAHLLCGSLAVTAPSLGASSTGTTTACITEMGTSGADFKFFITQAAGGASIVFAGIAASANSPSGVVTITFFNAGGADDANTTATSLHYIAIKDK